MKRIFISGAITGKLNNNEGAFKDAAQILRQMGYIAIVPHELMQQIDCTGFTHDDYCKVCCAELLMCDEMVQLNGWHNSKGAGYEKSICDLFKIPYTSIEDFISKNEQ